MTDSTGLPARSGSPFDAIMLPGECWSGRDLMPLLGYDKWQNFTAAVERASLTLANQGMALTSHVTDAGKLVERPQGGRVRSADFHLSRFACYLVAMNGDPRKPEVAAAQAYFAIRTREAETRPTFDPTQLTRQEILRIALNAEEEREALEAENKALAPRAEAYDAFMDTTGKFGVGAVAKMLGMSQNKLFRELRNNGVLISKGSMRNTPYQQYMRYFEVRAHEYERSNGEQGCSYTTYVQPSGIDFIRRKLDLPTIDPLPLTLQLDSGAA